MIEGLRFHDLRATALTGYSYSCHSNWRFPSLLRISTASRVALQIHSCLD